MAGIDTNTKLMLHCNGTDGSTTFTDSSGSEHTMTANGNAQIDTAQSVFGGASGLFDGSGDYVSVPYSSDFLIGSNNFTIDFWVRFDTLQNSFFYDLYKSSTEFMYLYFNSSANSLRFYAASGGSDNRCYSSWTPVVDTWYHVAFVRSGLSTYKWYIDGTALTVDTIDTSITNFNINSGTIHIGYGQDLSAYMNGWLDEYRFSTTARWTSNFTPPTSEYSEVISNGYTQGIIII